MMALDWSALALTAAALAAAGFVSGFLAGLLGIGGGAVIVLALYEAFRLLGIDEALRMHLATGTALAVMIPTSLRSFSAHRARGAADISIIRRMALPVLVGVVIGSLIAGHASGDVLKWVWVVMGSVLAARMFLGRDDWRLGTEIPASFAVEAYGIAIGIVSTLMSIGGGVFIVVLMTLYGRSLHQAVATSSGFAPPIAVPGIIGFMWAGWGVTGVPPGTIGYVSLLGAALVIPTGLLGAPVGARVSHGLSRRGLELAFGAFMAFVVLRFLASLTL